MIVSAASSSIVVRQVFPKWTSRSSSHSRHTSRDLQCFSKSDPSRSTGRSYFNVTGFPFPLGPYLERQTIRYEVLKDTIWTFEQPQSLGFSSVSTNVRMTVIRLKDGGLWVHAPVAPTEECIRLVKELGMPVKYIVLPTFAYEHKIFVGPFSRRFPKAKVYVAPSQWSWPIDLPPQLFGIFPTGIIKDADLDVPWSDEIEQKVFRPPDIGPIEDSCFLALSVVLGIGPYVECAFFHKASRTLLVTDLVIYIPRMPIDVIPRKNLLDLARNDGLNTLIAGDLTREQVEARKTQGPMADTPRNRRLGWARSVLLVLYFQPFSLLDPDASFDAIKERWLVSPVLRSLVYDSIPNSCIDFVLRIERDWSFKQIIPCHLAGPVKARKGDLSEAFRFSFEAVGRSPPGRGLSIGRLFDGRSRAIMQKDNATLDNLIEFLKKIGAVYKRVE